MKFFLSLSLILITSCSTIEQTFIKKDYEANKIFAGTSQNIDWVKRAPRDEICPYTVMGLVDYIPSVFGDIILLPYTIYDNYVEKVDLN